MLVKKQGPCFPGRLDPAAIRRFLARAGLGLEKPLANGGWSHPPGRDRSSLVRSRPPNRWSSHGWRNFRAPEDLDGALSWPLRC